MRTKANLEQALQKPLTAKSNYVKIFLSEIAIYSLIFAPVAELVALRPSSAIGQIQRGRKGAAVEIFNFGYRKLFRGRG